MDTLQIIKKTFVYNHCGANWKRVVWYNSDKAFSGEDCPACKRHQTSKKSRLMDLPEGSIFVWDEQSV